jgi:pilus assembly protein CpaB
MPIRTIATFAVAILLGLLAVFLVRNYLKSARPAGQQAAAGATVPVVVASAVIDRGKVLEAPELKLANYPADSVPTGAFHNIADLTGAAENKRVAIRPLAANEPILADKISGPGGRTILSTTLTEGMRAVSLRSNDIAGVAGFVLPGDRVDILLTRQVGEQQLTQVLAENVRVLGVDQNIDQGANQPQVARAVTVEVTPDQAQSISLAQAVGNVSLSLRHVSDQLPLTKRATTVADLSPAVRGPVTAAVVRRAHAAAMAEQIHVVRGVDSVAYQIR